jgi:hypothetical protein
VLKQLHLIFVNQVIISKIKSPSKYLSFFFLGEDKPQPFIPLDIDRQVDGKIAISNHVNISSPNGRLPMSSNYVPNTSMPLPLHLSQHKLNTPDGGVYHGQPPPNQTNQWALNSNVK